MVKEKEVNYKLQRITKDGYWDQYLTTIDGGAYYWADDYEAGDMFTSKEVLHKVIEIYNVEFTDKYNYYIVEDIVPEKVEYKEAKTC